MTQIKLQFRSRKMGTRIPVHMLLPEPSFKETPMDFYCSGERFKVLWLLHGGTETGEDYLIKYHVHQLLKGHKIITVMPSALNSDFANNNGFGSGFPFADFFFDELMPFVYATFPASNDPKDNYIAGYSMGGSGASMMGLKHPELFQGGIAPLGSALRYGDYLEPYLDMTSSEFRAFAEANRTLFPTTFGDPAAGIKPKEINMICRYNTVREFVNSDECTWNRFPEALARGNLPEMYFCCGELDLITYKSDMHFMEYAAELGYKNVSLDVIPDCDHPSGAPIALRMMVEHFKL